MSKVTIFLRVLSAALVLGSLFMITQSLDTESKKLIKIAFLGSKTDEDWFGSVSFKEAVERASGGKIKVLIYTSGQFCGNEGECVEGLRSGILDVHMTTFGFLSAFYPPAIAIDLPYVLENDQQAECVFSGPLFEKVQNQVLESGAGLRLMTIGNTGGWRVFANNTRPIYRLEDFEGLKIRVIASDLHLRFMRALGANPTPIPWSEVYTSVAEGVVDGTNNSIPDLVSINLHKSLKYYSVDNNAYMGAMWWYSDRNWQKLNAQEKEWVEEGFAALRETTLSLPKQEFAKSVKAIEDDGGQINQIDPVERKRIVDTATPVLREWYLEQFGSEWLDYFDKAAKDCLPPS